MRWSKKVAWMVGTSTWGMWQVMQLDLDWGQSFGADFSAEFCAVDADEWQVRHFAS